MTAAVLYPGTFDPITHGHEDLIRRAARLFGGVVIGVAASPSKSPLLPLDERIRLVRTVLEDVDGVVDVTGFEGLTVEFARSRQLRAIVRGVRSGSDLDLEAQLAAMNARLDGTIETVLLPATPELVFVSATLVREIATLGGDVSPFVHPVVGASLRAALARRE